MFDFNGIKVREPELVYVVMLKPNIDDGDDENPLDLASFVMEEAFSISDESCGEKLDNLEKLGRTYIGVYESTMTDILIAKSKALSKGRVTLIKVKYQLTQLLHVEVTRND